MAEAGRKASAACLWEMSSVAPPGGSTRGSSGVVQASTPSTGPAHGIANGVGSPAMRRHIPLLAAAAEYAAAGGVFNALYIQQLGATASCVRQVTECTACAFRRCLSGHRRMKCGRGANWRPIHHSPFVAKCIVSRKQADACFGKSCIRCLISQQLVEFDCMRACNTNLN